MTDFTAKVSQLVNCEPATAFDAFVNPAKITQFWLSSTSGPLAKGAKATWHFMVPGVSDSVSVDELQLSRLIALTWSDGSTVRLEFTEHTTGQTRVSVEASGSADSDLVEQIVNTTEGYSIVLCDMKTFLESGRSSNLVRAKAELIASAMAAVKDV
jgi:uncharacterized protein YndB with AHSA1/START domain